MKQQEFDLTMLSARVERLEAQSRRWKATSVITVLVLGSLLAMGSGRSDRVDSSTIKARAVEAQEFVLKDADGRVRARLNLPTPKLTPLPGPPPGMVYRENPAHVLPNQAALQFYDEDGDVVWVAPSTPSMVTLK
jgi:hypothetical protein